MVKWRPPEYEGDRRLALAGTVEIGAVFPPCGGGRWRWRLWIVGTASGVAHGEAVSELGAKTALDRAWAGFLTRANLSEAA